MFALQTNASSSAPGGTAMQDSVIHGMYPSQALLLTVDVTLFSIAVLGSVFVIVQWKSLRQANAQYGCAWLLTGVWTLVLTYSADFYTIAVLPFLIGEAAALEIQRNLHLRYSWYFNATASMLVLVGLVLLVVSLVRQIRAINSHSEMLQESESLLNSIFENAPVGFLIKDAAHRVENSNRTYQDWYGLGPDVLHGVRTDEVENFQPPKDVAIMNQQETEVITTGQTVHRQVSRRFADGEEHIVSITKFPVYDRHGNISKVGSVSVDMTEQVRAYEATNAALCLAEEANTAKSEFLATMSHEFRTPLNAILGFSEYLRAEFNGPLGDRKYLEYVGDIHTSGHHMLALVNDSLDISAIEAGKRTLDIETFELLPVMSECITNVQNQLRRRNIMLTRRFDAAPKSISADRRAITQVVLNILSNAAKFTEQDGAIDVAITHDDDGTTFTIADTGIGIAADSLLRITEPFTQGQTNPHLSQQGSGLGLSIVKSLVEMHGGTIDIESAVGEGTTVSFTIPANLRPDAFTSPAHQHLDDPHQHLNLSATTSGT